MKPTDWKIWLEKELLADKSKENVLRIAEIARNDGQLLESIFVVIEEGKSPYDWRAAWVLDHLNQIEPSATPKHLNRMIRFLPTTSSDSLRRTFLKIIGTHPIPDENSGVLMDECFKLLKNPASAIAVRAWCMNILVDFAKEYPEICNELKPILEEISKTGSAGEKSKANKMLKTLDKES